MACSPARPAGRRPLVDLERAHRPAGEARDRAGAVLLPGDHRGDRRATSREHAVLRRRGELSELAGLPLAEAYGAAAPSPRDRVRHRPPGRGVRGHPRLAPAAGRRRRPVFKLQEAAALWVPEVTARRCRAGALHRHHLPEPDHRAARRHGHPLPQPGRRDRRVASTTPAGRASGARTSTCRSSSTTSAPFRTTRFAFEQALRRARARRRCRDHLEIETYTWDVLPEHLKTGDITDYVVRELEFVRDAD